MTQQRAKTASTPAARVAAAEQVAAPNAAELSNSEMAALLPSGPQQEPIGLEGCVGPWWSHDEDAVEIADGASNTNVRDPVNDAEALSAEQVHEAPSNHKRKKDAFGYKPEKQEKTGSFWERARHPHKNKGLYYRIKLDNGAKMKGFLRNSQELKSIIDGINGALIVNMRISAHHGSRFYGTSDDPGLTDREMVEIADNGPFADRGKMVLRACNGQSVAPELKEELGEGWQVVYTVGVNTNIPGTKINVPNFVLKWVDEGEKGERTVLQRGKKAELSR